MLGLERVRKVLDRLGLATPHLVLSVGGTNGKGSSVAMLERMLQGDSIRTGSYTSPHVIHYNERIRIAGTPASDDVIVAALERVEAVRSDLPLTFFEFGTLAALVAFDAEDVEAWILEVGMGGRLDAVNAVEPHGSIITSISLDHCSWLGDDRETIAREKAGIMRRNKPVIFADPDMPQAILTIATELGADLRRLGVDYELSVAAEAAGRWSWRGRECALDELQRPSLPGAAQLQNAAGVLALLEAVGLLPLLEKKRVNDALGGIVLPGRFQIVEKRSRFILDVAHNPGAATVLGALLGKEVGPITAIIGMFGDKDVCGFLAPLLERVDRWYAVTVSGPRAASAVSLARDIANASGKPCRVVDDVQDAMQHAADHSDPGASILVTGSFYVVGPALEWLAT